MTTSTRCPLNGKRVCTIIGSLPSGLYRRPRNYTGSADPIPKDGRSRADVPKHNYRRWGISPRPENSARQVGDAAVRIKREQGSNQLSPSAVTGFGKTRIGREGQRRVGCRRAAWHSIATGPDRILCESAHDHLAPQFGRSEVCRGCLKQTPSTADVAPDRGLAPSAPTFQVAAEGSGGAGEVLTGLGHQFPAAATKAITSFLSPAINPTRWCRCCGISCKVSPAAPPAFSTMRAIGLHS